MSVSSLVRQQAEQTKSIFMSLSGSISIFPPLLCFGESENSVLKNTEFLFRIAETSAEFLICCLFLMANFLCAVFFLIDIKHNR